MQEAAAEDGLQQEFPDLTFGIRDLDQHKQVMSADIQQQDFPSLGGTGAPDAGPKPAGAWGRGTGEIPFAADFSWYQNAGLCLILGC